MDVAFPAERPRTDLGNVHDCELPLTALPPGSISLTLTAYQWQQAAQHIVPRHFVTVDGGLQAHLQTTVQALVCAH